MNESVRHSLRSATRRAHEAAEAAVMGAAPFASRSGFVRFLRRMELAHHALEEWLGPETRHAEAGRWPTLGRSSVLRDDLAALGVKADARPRRSTQPGFVLPALDDSTSSRAGVLYVVEGSALGGALLAAQAVERLGLDPVREARFLSGAGVRVGERWSSFLDWLEVAVPATGRETAAVSARTTFEWLAGVHAEVVRTPSTGSVA